MLPDSFYIVLKHCLSKFSPENQSFLHCLATPSCCQIQSIEHHNTTRNTIFNPACISQLLKFYWVKLHLVIVVKQIFIFFAALIIISQVKRLQHCSKIWYQELVVWCLSSSTARSYVNKRTASCFCRATHYKLSFKLWKTKIPWLLSFSRLNKGF